MKLIFCTDCRDVVALRDKHRECECGKSWGVYYDDGLHAAIGGSAVPLGFQNNSFLRALESRPPYGLGHEFSAFVIPVLCDTITVTPKRLS